jgi:serine/threonine protein kinase
MIGERLGTYQITEQLGAGGMGVVYRARDSRLHRDVAIKVIAADAAADSNGARSPAAGSADSIRVEPSQRLHHP